MSNSLGYSLSAMFLALLISATLSKIYLNKFHQGKLKFVDFILSLVIALLPAAFLFTIGLEWKFGANYIPTSHSEDLTYSSFHIIALLITFAFTVLLVTRAKKDRESEERYMFGRFDRVDYTVFFIGIMLLGIELFKQLYYLNLNQGIENYLWYGFPLQFCSVPMFLYPLTPFIKNKKIKDAVYSFIGIFTAVGGLAVMIVGQSVFTLQVAISVHTMLWHGAMVVVSIYVLAARQIGKSFKDYFMAIAVLIGFIILAQGVNVLFHYLAINHPGMATFDGFFINPWMSNVNMPVLSNIRISMQQSGMHVALVGILFSLLYFVAFSLGGLIIFMGLRIPYLVQNTKAKKELKNKEVVTASN